MTTTLIILGGAFLVFIALLALAIKYSSKLGKTGVKIRNKNEGLKRALKRIKILGGRLPSLDESLDGLSEKPKDEDK